MTMQSGETLIIEGQAHRISNEPLDFWFTLARLKPAFVVTCTACRRGYDGTWEIQDQRLYLRKLEGELTSGRPASLETVFPGWPDRVFAHWYSGMLESPQGRLLRVEMNGLLPVYEAMLYLEVEHGVVVGEQILAKPLPRQMQGRELSPAPRLKHRVCLEEVVVREVVSDPLRAAPDLPFGFLNPHWSAFLSRMDLDDELWAFEEAAGVCEGPKRGYAIVRGGEMIDTLMTRVVDQR